MVILSPSTSFSRSLILRDGSLLGYWTHLHSQVAGFQHIFLLIALLYLATIVPALLMVSPKREKGGGLQDE